MHKKYEIEIANQQFVFETGQMARQANGAVLGRNGGTAVLATSVMNTKESDADFFPLTVNYFEKAYAAGKFPGGYIKREGKPSDREVLIARLIDRPIRPLFPDGFNREVQVVSYALSSDQRNPADILAINSSILSLMLSDIPFSKGVGTVRAGYIDGRIVINPDLSQIMQSSLDIIVAGTKDAIIMIEGGAKEISEEVMYEACIEAHKEIIKIITLFEQIVSEVGKEKIAVTKPVEYPEFNQWFEDNIKNELEKAVFIKEKQARSDAITEVFEKQLKNLWESNNDIILKYLDASEESPDEAQKKYEKYFFGAGDALVKRIMREEILQKGIRADGRVLDEIRPITIELGLFDYTHGSALFTRGETQSLAISTLGTVVDQQRVDDIEGEIEKRFMLHYNFPPFSVGETGRYGSPGRREIGHGHLAERSLEYIIPEYDEFPYTIRIVSEILESNGSSSMASVCGGSLSMFNAGVPIKKHVAGIAMGLVTDGQRHSILTDIMGMEDHLGDMDFKVAGTKDGITGFQMDVKIEGISYEVFKEALGKANEGRMRILKLMEDACVGKNNELSPIAPKIKIMKIDPEKIGLVIGPGGKTIRSIQSDTNSTINIEEDGTVMISNKEQTKIEETMDYIQMLVNDEVLVDNVYLGTVKKILEFGLLVEFAQNKVGLCHISEIAPVRVNNLPDIYKPGDKLKVRLTKIDPMGKFSLTHKEFFDGKN